MIYLLFEDVAEQEHVFALLDELAGQMNQRAKIDFSNPNYVLMRRLYLLSSQIHDYEKKLQFDSFKTSYQRAIVNYLLDRLESSDRADKLGAALTEIKELLLKAWAINLEMLCGIMKPLADVGGKFYGNGRPKGAISSAVRYITDLAKDNRALSAKQLFAKADKNSIGSMAESTFGNHVSKARKEYPKEKNTSS